MNKIIFKITIVCTFCAFLFSCSSPSTVQSWKNPDDKNIKINNLFNFAILKYEDYKQECEGKIVMGFEYEKLICRSPQEFPEFNINPSLESLDKILKENKFNYFLTIKYLEKISDKADYSTIEYQEYFKKGLERINKPDYKYKEDIRNSELLEVIIFSVKDKKPVWAGIIKTIDDNIVMEVAIELTIEIMRDLKKEGLINK